MSTPLTYLSLFSGIGGLDLGLDRAGMTCVGQIEADPFCRSVLDHHWPEVPKHDDVCTAPTWWRSRPRPAVRLVAGGFPCQPFSAYGLRRGTADTRWGWPWFRDMVRAVRPDYVLVENVAALLRDTHAFGRLLGDLAEDGFDADWTVLSACALGAPHTRERLFLVAYTPRRDGQQPLHLPTALPTRRPRPGTTSSPTRADRWLPEPAVGRVAHGLPKRLVASHLHALGNAVVPQVAETVGRLIVAADTAREVSR
ncbi:DNA (cytosine-5)-methyltransferase 1 [Micromonospora echinospora]|uniref:DNA (cytosine-5-)-methyltransferase n=1 Tax=Micromonospora echinospora TaxID=1877 RepID=A0ABR6M654_MICEC|nr:DNA cytosine methyltransferase [Micromonospora echinospora]MBB5110554.1 DNA (cytosine-5)-methyltransferase 1 [Micromonospora echinospora]